MASLATLLGEDAGLWEMTGLCHDLDFEVTSQDRCRHGMVAAEWLAEDLPPQALLAIQSHDYRTGVESVTPLADALKLVDALAIAEIQIGRMAPVDDLRSDAPERALHASLPSRSYLAAMILRYGARLGLSELRLSELLHVAPEQ